jgi:hypothetical protein
MKKFKLRADAIQAEAVSLFAACRYKTTIFQDLEKHYTHQYWIAFNT